MVQDVLEKTHLLTLGVNSEKYEILVRDFTKKNCFDEDTRHESSTLTLKGT